MPKKKSKKPRSARAEKAARKKRVRELREARVIIAHAALQADVDKRTYVDPPSYYKIAKDNALDRKSADLADEIYNDVNGADDYTIACEERAMERAQDLLEMELEDAE